MENVKIWNIYFSPTGGTKKVCKQIVESLGQNLCLDIVEVDFTKKENREKQYQFSSDDLVLVGSPVYAGRVPNKILPDFSKCFSGNDTKAIVVCTYGGRSAGSAVTELEFVLQRNKFRIVGAAEVVCEHAFTNKVASKRPDEKDIEEIEQFSLDMGRKLCDLNNIEIFPVVQEFEIQPYYIPLKVDKTPAKFLSAKPVTDMNKCIGCEKCASVCPMQSIENNNVSNVTGICIKCQACIKICSNHAKYFEDEQFLSHIKMLEMNYRKRSENSLILKHSP